MDWKKKTVCRILLLVAKIVASDTELAKDLDSLNSHISVNEWLTARLH